MAAPPSDDDDDDCWGAFGSDDEQDQDTTSLHHIEEQGVLWLTQYFLSWNPSIFASQRRVYCRHDQWTAALQARGMQVVTTSTELVDAAIVSTECEDIHDFSVVKQNVVPNGVIMTVAGMKDNDTDTFDDRVWSEVQRVDDTTTTTHCIIYGPHQTPMSH